MNVSALSANVSISFAARRPFRRIAPRAHSIPTICAKLPTSNANYSRPERFRLCLRWKAPLRSYRYNRDDITMIRMIVLACLVAAPVAAQVSSTQVGKNTFYQNGVTATQVGSNTFYSNGTTATKVGANTFYSNGVTATQVGNQTHYSNGTTATQVGNQTVYSNGKRCEQIGAQRHCG